MEFAIVTDNKTHPGSIDAETITLIRKVISGEEEALNFFIETHKRFVISVIWSYARNEDDIQDICQEVFIKVCRYLAKFKFKSSLKTWIAAITVNECRKFHQRNKASKSHVELDTDEVDRIHSTHKDAETNNLFARDLLERIHKTVSRLPGETQLLFRLRFIEEMDSSEIADAMKMPAGTVRSRISELRGLLQNQLQGGEFT